MASFLSHYLWWILALLLIGGEVLAPGFFLLWIGIAAAVMGVVTLVFPGLGVLAQGVLFVALSFASCIWWWKWLRPRMGRDDDPASHTINQRAQRMVGRRYVVAEAIVNGRGKVHVGDSQWLAMGPDMPVGSEVRVVAVDGVTLRVEPAG